MGNRKTKTDNNGTHNYTYDTLNRLVEAVNPLPSNPLESFTYDPVGNRVNSNQNGSSTFNTANQLTEDANFTYQYDLNGNLILKTPKTPGPFTSYEYDAENALVRVVTPGKTVNYKYDGLGRRMEKEILEITATVTRYIYDNEDILLELDGSNNILARYTHGPGVDEPIAMARGGSTFFYHQDGIGTVTELTDSSGATRKSYSYDAFGNILDQAGAVQQPYTYTGREFDMETGQYYYRARYYDPRIGRFSQRDPAGFFGGINFYAYVGNNPTVFVDPFGLFSSLEALKHYLGGSGTPVSVPFSDIDTSSVKATDFVQVNDAINSCKPGTYPVNDAAGFSTTGDAARYLGNITLKLKGAVRVNCDCSWCFRGTLSAYPDVYDFNPSTHRTLLGELATKFGSYLPGKPYTINIVGSKPVNQCSEY